MADQLPHPDCEACRFPNKVSEDVHLIDGRLKAVEKLAMESQVQRDAMHQSITEILEALVGNPKALVKEKRRGVVDDIADAKKDIAEIKAGNIAKQSTVAALVSGIITATAAYFTHKQP